jgi:single-strand DNA-binding protein
MSTPVTVICNLTRNPQLSRTGEGTPVVNLILAENARRLVDGEWVDGPTTFWQVACFGAQAEHVIASLHRGARAIAVGVFRTRTWSGGEGEERSAFEIVAEEIGPSLRWATTEVTRATAG